MGEASSGEWILEVEAVTRSYGGTHALRGAELRIRDGEYFCILGPSGCGKSTLLRMIAGFEEPDTGDLRLAGRTLLDTPPERRDVNTVFQSYALFPHMTIRENVEFGPRMKGWPEDRVRDEASRMLEIVQLADRAEHFPEQLSGGQRQRVALARALVNAPRLLLLDEPLAALDRNLRHDMQRELRKLQRDTGTTFIQVTHDQEEAMVLSDRLAVMNRGRVVQEGSPTEVYLRPRTPFVAGFLGLANLLEGVLTESGVAIGEALELPRPPGPEAGGQVRVMVRPENLRLLARGEEASPGGTTFPARVRDVSDLGSEVEVFLEARGVELIARSPGSGERLGLTEGQEVGVSVLATDVILLGEDEG